VNISLNAQAELELVEGAAYYRRGIRLRARRPAPRHRFRIASHSKSFTASAILLLREQGLLGLDDPIGRYVGSLQGFASRTSRFPAAGLTISVQCNAQDGLAWLCVDGIASILGAFAQHGAPAARLKA
jgi:hypothetical protein